MSNWSEQLLSIGFEKTKKADGTECYCYEAAHRRRSFWTRITVKQIDRPNPSSWQATYARSEIQIGIWNIHSVVRNIDVIVYANCSSMLDDIKVNMQRKPNFLLKISN